MDPSPERLVILAGGENARMEGLRGTIYKAFLPIHGASCIARHVLRAGAYAIGQVDVIVDVADPALYLLAHHEGSGESALYNPTVRIMACPGTMSEKLCWYIRESNPEPPLLVALADSLAPVDLLSLWSSPLREGVDSSIALAEFRLPFGAVEIAGGLVTAFTEKPQTGRLVNTGYMALGRTAFHLLQAGADMAGTLVQLANRSLLACEVCTGGLVTVDSVDSLATAHRALSDRPLDGCP